MADPGAEVVLGTLPGMGREMRELEREALGERREEEDVFPIVGCDLRFEGLLRGCGLGLGLGLGLGGSVSEDEDGRGVVGEGEDVRGR